MYQDHESFLADMDALHILPLSIIPLETKALQRARLVKNSRLEGVVEMFGGRETGSGQIKPDRLGQVFDITDKNRKDVQMIKTLCPLPAYDVYSLRIELRRLGIPVNDLSALRLSDPLTQELTGHMRTFTQPLVKAVYGELSDAALESGDVVSLFRSPNIGNAKENILALADQLEIGPMDLPQFLEEYGDIYLSLAYYRNCMEENLPYLEDFLESLDTIQQHPSLRSNASLKRICSSIRTKLSSIILEVNSILDMFKARTEEMWKNISRATFKTMKDLITTYQVTVAGALCAITVKMNAWKKKFPEPYVGGPLSRADFVMNEMRHGMDKIAEIQYADVAV